MRKTGALFALVSALLLTACAPRTVRSLLGGGGPEEEARAFLDAWERDDLTGERAALATTADGFEDQLRAFRQRLGVVRSRFDRLRVVRAGEESERSATVTFRAVHTLRGLGDWEVTTSLRLEKRNTGDGADRWRVRFGPAVLHPDARPGDQFARLRARGPRGHILDARGRALTGAPGEVDGRRIPEGLALQTVGHVGAVTAEALAALGPPYQTGDVVGLSGLERALERPLAGAPSGEVRLVRRSGERVTLHRFSGAPGRNVPTTLRLEVQAAAEAALAAASQPAALAAVDADSGQVLALASRPSREALNRALTGLYPPGSTFKIVTAEALLAQGLRPESRIDCPAEVTVAGKRFGNFEGEALGATSFRAAFAQSCNTAFVIASARLGDGALGEAARRFGFGAVYTVGLPAPPATYPEPRDDAERAAAAIGQGRVLATPLHMASVVAAAGTGTWHAPRLLDARAAPEFALSAGAAPALRALMKAVVEEGTGRAAARVQDLVGKTGTAEFGEARPPATHAWFLGLYRKIGFAVLVEGGGVGGRVAAPIAAAFARRLGSAP